MDLNPWTTGVLIRGNLDTQRPGVGTQTGDHVITEQKGHHLQTKRRSPRRNQTFWHLDLGLLVSRTIGNTFLLFKPLSLWYIIVAALVSYYNDLDIPSIVEVHVLSPWSWVGTFTLEPSCHAGRKPTWRDHMERPYVDVLLMTSLRSQLTASTSQHTCEWRRFRMIPAPSCWVTPTLSLPSWCPSW